MAKRNREKIHLVSTAKTGYFYTARKNKKKSTEKLKLMKYDPVARKKVEFVESKKNISSSGKNKK